MKKVFSFVMGILFLFASFDVEAKSEPKPKPGIESVTAPSAVLVDANSGKVLYEKNSHEARMCASITKVMTLLLVFDAIDDGRLKLDDEVLISSHAASMDGSNVFLEAGEKMSVNDLIKSVVIVSANDAAVALAECTYESEEKFVSKMNERAKILNMNDTVFKNCNGLDQEGHVSSAYDIAIMSRELMKHEQIFSYTSIWMDYLRNGKTQLVSTNKLLKTYPGITGLKTGTTDGAGCCMVATANRNKMSLISVVLGCNDSKARFSDSAIILNYGFENFFVVPLKFDKSKLTPLKIVAGMKDDLQLDTKIPQGVLLSKDSERKIKTTIEVPEMIDAPVKSGQVVGKVVYSLGDEVLDEGEIFATEDVERMSFGKIFSIVLRAFTKM